ncbi:unnamed protein product [Clonostachys rosea]|uniref:Heterokaryon incompatibility domain-containing protein n=1 Tax=Bionectria ochroleuca TaxID=29856 RepID=A0ABY6UEZ1_BIOOC|nr:unnamed protein product [Clonostachys rosea]
MISNSPLYIYQPIAADTNSRETRLVTVQPGAWAKPIVISFEHVSLLRKGFPSFEALSYCWGDPEKIEEVRVEQGGVLHVTKNLSLALRHLRHEKSKTRTLWIDDLCINQADQNEKSMHVQWMGYVYQTAPRVVVFLGELGGRNAQAMDLLVEYGNSYTVNQKTSKINIKRGYEGSFIRGTETPDLNQVQTNDINDLMSRPWFSRLWVIQEVALMTDPKNSTVQCGNKSVSWEEFRRGYWLMSVHPPENMLRPGSKLAALKAIPEASYALCDPSWGMNIVDVFWGVQEFGCSEFLDRFYGVLSLLKREDLKYDIKVDYKISPGNLFEKVQRIEIKTVGVHLLRFCELERQKPGNEQLAGQRQGRSWVPMPANMPSFLSVMPPNPMVRFKSKYRFHNDGCLEVYGESIGSIVSVFNCEGLANDWKNGADFAFILNELHYLYTIGLLRVQNKDVENVEATLMAAVEVLSRHLCDESSPGHKNPSHSGLRSFVSEFCNKKRLDPMVIPEIEDETLRDVAVLVRENLDEIFRKPPVLYLTDKGDIGLGTSATARGDRVCAIYGVHNFMILRPDGAFRYRVVGPTCVSGQELAEAILGRFVGGHDNIWMAYDYEAKIDDPYFEVGEFDIDTNQSPLAEKLRRGRQSFVLA